MRQWFEKVGRKIQVWMIGRYGTDELSRCLLWTGIVLMLVSGFMKQRTLVNITCILAWAAVIFSYYRTFSKNIIKRSRERDRYLRITSGIRSKIPLYKKMWRDRKTHNYYRCPNCRTMIRVPKGKGKIVITCTRCRHEITRTT